MDVKGKINIFVEDRARKDGSTFKKVSGSISHKNTDGERVNAKIAIQFDKENFPDSKLSKLDPEYCYTLEVAQGWLDCRAYTTKDGKNGREVFIFVKEANIVNSSKINKPTTNAANDKYPF